MLDADAALDFLREHMSLPDGRRLRETMPDDPWIEADVLRPILAVNGDGLPLHPLVYVELARGHWKTGGVAAVAMVEALRADGTEVYAIASDFDQAALLVEAMRGQARRNPLLARLFHQTKYEFSVPSTGSRIRIMSSDAPSFFGIGVDARRLRIVCDELGQWQGRELFDAAITTLPKARDAQLVIISNAGVKGTWQEEVRMGAAASGYHLFSAPGVIASWIRPEDLERVKATVPPPVFARFYENKWVEEVGGFIEMEAWDACQATVPPLDAHTPVVIGVDAAVSGDCFACVAVSRDPDRPRDGVMVRDVRIWKPDGGLIDFDEPRAYLAEFCRAHRVVQVAYDPFQLHDFMTQFQRANTVWCEPFQQGPQRAKADSDLFQLIRAGRLVHDGEPSLREHAAACGFKVAAQEDTRARLVKRGKAKIDAAVALSMAASACLYLLLEQQEPVRRYS